MEKERSTLQDQLGQRKQEFDVSSQESSALLMRKDEIIKRLEADLYRSGGDLNAALEKACDLQERLDVHSVDMQELQSELQRLREESKQKDAANEGLDDRRFDAEVALANDRRAFEFAQNELLEWSREAEAQSRHKGKPTHRSSRPDSQGQGRVSTHDFCETGSRFPVTESRQLSSLPNSYTGQNIIGRRGR